MKRIFLVLVSLLLAYVACVGILIKVWTPQRAHAEDSVSASLAANLTRPCNPDGATQQNVSVTATSARTTNATAAQGTVRVTCTQDAYMTTGTVGPTATTSHILIKASSPPERFYLPPVKVAFIRSSADGTCQVLECK